MALEDFRVEGLGQISQLNFDCTVGVNHLIGVPTANDHTVDDNWDKDGTALLWIQPQDRIHIYKVILSSVAASANTLGCDDATENFETVFLPANGHVVLGSEAQDGKHPLFVCNAGTNFVITTATAISNAYIQYRVVTPRKLGD